MSEQETRNQSVQRNDSSLQQSFQQMIENSPLGIAILDQDLIRYSNAKFVRLLGAGLADTFTNKSITQHIHPSYLKYFNAWLNKMSLTNAMNTSFEVVMFKADNEPINVEIYGSLIQHKGVPLIQICVSDITERKRSETELKYLAMSYSLTNSINNNLLSTYLTQAIKSSDTKHHAAVFFMDLDHLKLVNETYGHAVGDQLLQAVMQRLKRMTQSSDVILSMGGDKFVLIMNKIPDINMIQNYIQKMNNEMSHSFRINDHEVFTTITAGISVYPENGVDGETILKNAELAHYYAKQQGQNNFRYYDSSMSRYTQEKSDLLSDLRNAINNQELNLLYQPIIDTVSGKIVRVEALLRWHRLKNEMLLPLSFLSVAEEAGLILDIGNWVIKTSFNQNLLWQQQGISPLPISVNLSTRQFHVKSELVNVVNTMLRESKLNSDFIEFEMSENVTVLDVGSNILQDLKKIGIRLTIDNFGASYFSLNELMRYRIDNIKIDQSLIKSLPGDTKTASIISAIIAMANKLGLNVIGEGVETEEQLAFLKSHGCHQIQGNLFYPPLCADELYSILCKQK